ncbi:BQ5605_C002g01505 [Microbotryum silenes-dioicae]|uniref:BQ5605_C002g01505 protein n=1 Tax=Microbotryum silenes-dioicae TaxID=796604 RepID=A0A2X0MKW8_9BASI|nr:BQ5605_C002g01505 [Microbotryum silenes-dioicae]
MAIGGISHHLSSIVLWAVLPQLLTSFVLKGFYTLLPQIQPRLPPNASADQIAHQNSRAQRHHRFARIGLILAYLGYTLSSVYIEQGTLFSQNFYTLLGLTREQVEVGGSSFVKSHFRRLARSLHPDKVGKQGEPLFIALKQAALVLENEGSLKWAYERFGMDALAWQPKPAAQREVVFRGAQSTVGFYVVALGSIYMISWFRRSERVNNYWRYLFLLATAALEFHIILRTSLGLSFAHPFLSLLLPNRLPYEQIQFLRQLFISGSMALSHLTPLISTASMLEASLEGSSIEERLTAQAYKDTEAIRPLIQDLTMVLKGLEQESRMLKWGELRPLLGEGMRDEQFEEILEDVSEKTEDLVKYLKVKVGEGTKEAWKDAVQRGAEKHRVEEEVRRKRDEKVKEKVKEAPVKQEQEKPIKMEATRVAMRSSSNGIKTEPTTTGAATSALTKPARPPDVFGSKSLSPEDEAAIIARARLLSPPPET